MGFQHVDIYRLHLQVLLDPKLMDKYIFLRDIRIFPHQFESHSESSCSFFLQGGVVKNFTKVRFKLKIFNQILLNRQNARCEIRTRDVYMVSQWGYILKLVTVSSCCVIGASLEAVVEKAKFLYCACEATAAAGLGYPLENSALTFS